MMNLLLRYIIICLVGIISANNYVFAQFPTTCTAPRAIDATIFNTINDFSIVNNEFWYEFKIDPLTANRFISISLNNGTRPTRINYEIYGPFETSYNCNTLGTPFTQGDNYSYSLVSQTSQCATYQETSTIPSVKFQMTSSSNTRFYLVKIILLPGEFTTQQVINISSTMQPSSGNSTVNQYCSTYNDGVNSGCNPNEECHSPFTICTDFTQVYDCSPNCGFEGRHNRFYVLDIQYANTTVNVSIPTPFSTNSSVNYSLSNQMLYGPCEPSLMSPTNLLQSGSGQSFSYTFPNTGLYLLNVSINEVECPTIEIDFVDIDENCQPVVPPPTCESNLSCETVTKLCNDLHVESPCECNGSSNYLLWYEFVITDLSQQLNISGNVYNLNPSTTNPLNFQYYLAKPPVADYECNSDLQNYIIATGTTTSLNYAFNTVNAGLGTYVLVIDPQCDGNQTYDFDISFTPELNCDEDPLCETCIGSFAPIPGQKYLVTAWAKEVGALPTKTTYDNPQLSLLFNDVNNTVLGPFIPTGDIIDGWQRIEVEFVVPSSAQEMEILFGSVSGEVLFDDIRVLPFNSNMKSFVYDPINMRLVAELDERHYATFYEYDEEGQLIRVKKETERGIMTIQETKSNTSKPE